MLVPCAGKRADQLPYAGSNETAEAEMLPLLEQIFEMPALRPDEGTKEWIDLMCDMIAKKPTSISFEYLLEYVELFRVYHASMMARANRKGW